MAEEIIVKLVTELEGKLGLGRNNVASRRIYLLKILSSNFVLQLASNDLFLLTQQITKRALNLNNSNNNVGSGVAVNSVVAANLDQLFIKLQGKQQLKRKWEALYLLWSLANSQNVPVYRTTSTTSPNTAVPPLQLTSATSTTSPTTSQIPLTGFYNPSDSTISKEANPIITSRGTSIHQHTNDFSKYPSRR